MRRFWKVISVIVSVVVGLAPHHIAAHAQPANSPPVITEVTGLLGSSISIDMPVARVFATTIVTFTDADTDDTHMCEFWYSDGRFERHGPKDGQCIGSWAYYEDSPVHLVRFGVVDAAGGSIYVPTFDDAPRLYLPVVVSVRSDR